MCGKKNPLKIDEEKVYGYDEQDRLIEVNQTEAENERRQKKWKTSKQ
jgi:hypothetical protein